MPSKPTPRSEAEKNTEEADKLIELIYELRSVDLDSPLAKLNETTIPDNNGGRIEL